MGQRLRELEEVGKRGEREEAGVGGGVEKEKEAKMGGEGR